MSEYDFNSAGCKKGVPIKVDRIFDSCSDKDCFSDLPVNLSGCELPCDIKIVKSRCVTVQDVCISIEPVPFNKGFFSVDITYTFGIELLGYERSCTTPNVYNGTVTASKSCILYGSESSVRTFFSDGRDSTGSTDECCNTVNLPTVSVSVVEPIALETKIGEACSPESCSAETECRRQRTVFVTLGLFSVIEITRPMTIMVPTLDYTVPKHECCFDNDSPCDIFERLKFPTEEFSPQTLTDESESCECDNHERSES